MKVLRFGFVSGPLIGALWVFVLATTMSIAMSFATGDAFRPVLIVSLVLGAVLGAIAVLDVARIARMGVVVLLCLGSTFVGVGPIVMESAPLFDRLAAFGLALLAGWSLLSILQDAPLGALTRHEMEQAWIRFLTGFGYIFFTAIVVIPFYVMVMTSLKSQSALLQNPLDFSLDLDRGWALFRSYQELFRNFNFGIYTWTSL